MTIYDRINTVDIKKEDYEKFLANDKNFVTQYSFNLSLYSKNKAEVKLSNINYKLISEKLDAIYINEDELVIEITCKYPMELMIDKLEINLGGVNLPTAKMSFTVEMNIFTKII